MVIEGIGSITSFVTDKRNGSSSVWTLVGGIASVVFPNTADPYSSVVFNQDRYYRVAHARIRLGRANRRRRSGALGCGGRTLVLAHSDGWMDMPG
jgi:hypothetical protein